MPIQIERLLKGKLQHNAADKAWLAKYHEDVIDPQQPIIDAHHHLYDRPGHRFMLPDLLEDIGSGHNIRGSVFIDSNAMYRQDGTDAMAPVGEIEFANGVAAMCASGTYGEARICAGIIGFADLTLGDAVAEVLDAEIAAGGGRFRGVRVRASWDADPALKGGKYEVQRDLLQDSIFLAGFRQLARRKLGFEAWIYHPQLGELADLARAFPETPIMLNHAGGPMVSVGHYAGQRSEEIARWRGLMAELAKCPNVFVKLGGMASPHFGFGFNKLETPPSSEMLADAWAPFFPACIDLFGPDRCMFESNFPPDKQSCSYTVLWNSYKRVVQGFSAAERNAMFFETANSAYRLNLTPQ
jgi:predicted TIM-barrel fold metal-dependent hydrolase